jgi:colicin import membrane protein
MPASADRVEFLPPPPPGQLRALGLAVFAHLLLMLALTWGISWDRETENLAVEAELWASVPRQAAPQEMQLPPAPPPPPPQPQVAPAPPPPAARDAAIVLEREKLAKEQAQRRQQELERQQKLAETRKREQLEREKKLEARKQQEEQKKQQLAQKKAAEEKERRRKEELAKAKEREEEANLAALRKENLDRIQGMAGATGAQNARGEATVSSGPSESYAGRVRARVRPNIVFTEDLSGNPTAEVEVRMAPDGTITSRRLIKSSGSRAWDEAVLRAVDKTEVLPRDVDGRIHSPLIIEFRPKG